MRAMLVLMPIWPALACGTNDTEVTEERLGQVEVTLTGADGEGNTWRLPAGTYLHVSKGMFEDTLPLDGNTSVASFSLPVGTFEWQLANPNVVGNEWPLEREDPQNNVEIVNATLANPQPDNFLILPSSTTGLTLQFNAAQGGTISFMKGIVDVDLEVTETPATGADFECSGNWQATIVQNGSTAPPVLANILPAVGNTFNLAVVGSVAGPWEMWANDRVCAPIDINAAGGPTSALTDLLFEAADDGNICLLTNGVVTINLFAQDAPSTSTFSGLGSTLMLFGVLFVATLPAPAFDGENLDLDLLSGMSTSASTVFLSVDELSNGGGTWYSATANGQATFSFAPTL
jgi:hypothetical protein